MSMIYNFVSRVTNFLPPEFLHKFFIQYLKYIPKKKSSTFLNLKTSFCGKVIANPLGIAAGFDKNGEAIDGCFKLGFGYVEVGTVAPMPQYGNSKPRVFKIPEYETIIQRLGFNNLGIENLINNLKKSKVESNNVIGINIGRNKNSSDHLADYLNLYKIVTKYSDYITINISSPNTPGLRDMQGKKQIDKLITQISKLKNKKNTFIKISPDISDSNLENICKISMNEEFISGLILTNTTIERDMLFKKPVNDSWKINESGGLSGHPLKNLSNKLIEKVYQICQGKLMIIGVGGIYDGRDAFEKISLGANLIQLYTSLVYRGPNVVNNILEELSIKLKEKNIKSVKDLVGQNISYD